MPMIVKSDQSRVPFDEGKLRGGMEKALQKRPVSREALDESVSRILHKLRSMGERELSSRAVGELVMEELHLLDEVAYVRFASVYRSFQNVEAFSHEIEKLHHRRSRAVAHAEALARNAGQLQLPGVEEPAEPDPVAKPAAPKGPSRRKPS